MPTISSAQFFDATWEDIDPRYQELMNRPLADTAAIEQWLADWNALDTAVIDAEQRAYVANSCDSENEEKESRHLRFQSDIMPERRQAVAGLIGRLLETGYSRSDLDETIRRYRTDRDIFREENIPIQKRLGELINDYSRICGSMKVEWDGEMVSPSAVSRYLEDADRDTRKAAFRKGFEPYIAHREELAAIFDEMLDLRQRLARNAGFENYRDYMFAELHRFDYTPEDCVSFYHAVRESFIPLIRELREQRLQEMGLDSLRPWDWDGDPQGRPGLRPFENASEFVQRTERVLTKVDPTFGAYFQQMVEGDLLDLETRTGKHPGGYCTEFPETGEPFIFMNASGSTGDVSTLLHESGHAVHSYLTAELPFREQRQTGMEMAEVASMAMELLASEYMGSSDGGFYDDTELIRARRDHLVGEIQAMRHYALVDQFQHWLYTDDAARDADARDQKWLELFMELDPVTDWTGIEDLARIRWYRVLHIFEVPFYFIEYGIAWMGAVQIWRNYLNDPKKATGEYRAALALGSTKSLPDLYAAAGIRLIFDREGMAELAAFLRGQLAAMK